MLDTLRAQFRPEFINRVDEIIVFHALTRVQMRSIIDIQLKGLMKRLEDRKIRVELSDRAKDLLIAEGYDPTYGARPLKRTIQRQVLDPLAMRVLQGEFKEGDVIGDRRGRRRAAVHPRREVGPDLTDVESVQMSEETPGNAPTPRGRRLPPRPAPGTTMWYVLGALLFLAVGNLLFFSLQAGEPIPYSEFKLRVREGKVQEVTVAADRIQGQLKAEGPKGRSFFAIRIDDPKLIEDLEQHGVKYSGEIANPCWASCSAGASSCSSWSCCGASSSAAWAEPRVA